MTASPAQTPNRPGMRRVAVAFIAVPVLASLFFGIGAMIALPIMFMLTGLVMLPTFLFLRRKGWLRWWHAVLAGFACSMLGCALILVGTSAGYVDAFGLGVALNLAAIGAAAGAAFWWIGIFRNPAFPFVPAPIPYAMAGLIPLVIASVLAQKSFEPVFLKGRIVEVRGEVPFRNAHVRLQDGTVVDSSLADDTRPASLLVDQCWHVMNHWSTRHFGRVYSLESPAGDDPSACEPMPVVQTVIH
jgi:hypothetical protein